MIMEVATLQPQQVCRKQINIWLWANSKTSMWNKHKPFLSRLTSKWNDMDLVTLTAKTFIFMTSPLTSREHFQFPLWCLRVSLLFLKPTTIQIWRCDTSIPQLRGHRNAMHFRNANLIETENIIPIRQQKKDYSKSKWVHSQHICTSVDCNLLLQFSVEGWHWFNRINGGMSTSDTRLILHPHHLVALAFHTKRYLVPQTSK